MSDFLRERIGSHQYKSPRANGIQDFTIDEQLISEFEEMEAHQFDCCNIYNKVRVWGLFGEEDTLAHFEPLFLEHYLNAYHFPGAHTPTAEQVKTWYVPLIEKPQDPATQDAGTCMGLAISLPQVCLIRINEKAYIYYRWATATHGIMYQ